MLIHIVSSFQCARQDKHMSTLPACGFNCITTPVKMRAGREKQRTKQASEVIFCVSPDETDKL